MRLKGAKDLSTRVHMHEHGPTRGQDGNRACERVRKVARRDSVCVDAVREGEGLDALERSRCAFAGLKGAQHLMVRDGEFVASCSSAQRTSARRSPRAPAALTGQNKHAPIDHHRHMLGRGTEALVEPQSALRESLVSDASARAPATYAFRSSPAIAARKRLCASELAPSTSAAAPHTSLSLAAPARAWQRQRIAA